MRLFYSITTQSRCRRFYRTHSIKISTYRRRFLCSLLLSSFIILSIDYYRSISDTEKDWLRESTKLCFRWQSIDNQRVRRYSCLSSESVISSVWSHEGTGLVKYIQWIVTRKLGNIKVLQLNDNCEIVRQNYFSSSLKTNSYVQVYIISLTMNFANESTCSTDLEQIIKFDASKVNQIYFKRRSVQATVGYQHLDKMRQHRSFTVGWNISLNAIITKANFVTECLVDYFNITSNAKLIIINSEDMIHPNLTSTEKTLTEFISLLGLNPLAKTLHDIIQHDSYQFVEDAIWWDQSETIEYVLSTFLQSIPGVFNESNDFYYMYGNRSFPEYLSDSRQCFNDGIFFQMKIETTTNRSSLDKSERCSHKPFDCAFSDLYSFSDREQLYQSYSADEYFNRNPVKCGFAIQSILDTVRNRYGRNHTCQTIVFTSITNCYDALPIVQETMLTGYCFVALLDTKTMNAFKKRYPSHIRLMNAIIQWDFIDLGRSDLLFRVGAKLTETVKMLGHRMFPIAKWIVWLDGKAFIKKINKIVAETKTPIIGLHHSDFNRTSESEVDVTITRVVLREIGNFVQLNISLQEIELQRTEYKRNGFYSRSALLKLPLFDIAIFVYRNHHPCSYRYLCGWHNEVNYFSYRGQLSVYYPAERLNMTDYIGFIPRSLYHTLRHRSMC